MRTKLAPALLTLALLAGPLFAAATTTDDLIQDLLRQIQQLQQQLAQLQGQENTTTQSCVVLSNNLYPGRTDNDTNGEVSKLQQFLASDRSIYPEGKVTGYFGPATTRAVQRWQKAHDIVSSGNPETTGYGYVGPKTRAAMACRAAQGENSESGTSGSSSGPQDSTSNAVTFTATPSNGPAPLSVTFTSSVFGLRVDFGDGANGDTTGRICTNGTNGQLNCPSSYVVSHTYATEGTYTAKLLDTRMTCVAVGCNVVGTVAITVSQAATPAPVLSASPASGTAPLSITFTGTKLADNRSYTLEFGDGQQATVSNLTCSEMAGGNTCQFSTSHTYSAAGTYTAKLYDNSKECSLSAGCDVVGTATVTVTGQSTGISFTAAPTSGTAPLSVTFTSSVFGLRVDFGDGANGDTTGRICTNGTNGQLNCPSSYVVSHTYATEGTYTAKLLDTRMTCVAVGCNVVGTVAVTVAGHTPPAFTASPVSGAAPLTVVFSIGPAIGYFNSEHIEFGDGQTGIPNAVNCLVAPCDPAATASHTYTSAGTYTAKLHDGRRECPSSTNCDVVGTATVAVTGATQ